MARTASSQRWLKEHVTDIYVKQARERGYRSRSAFKLLEIDERDHLFRPGMMVIDLGAAPGGWSQVAAERIGTKGRVIAVDMLPMDPLEGVVFIQQDFSEELGMERLLEVLGERKADLVLSDMAPNMSGVKAMDQPRSLYLAELALDCAIRLLRPGGDFLVKVFQGEGSDDYLKQLRTFFQKAHIRKPKASRGRSGEIYVLGRSLGKERE
jgi:23S rRNA (uridine2552-2'-O)-methyltransferase